MRRLLAHLAALLCLSLPLQAQETTFNDALTAHLQTLQDITVTLRELPLLEAVDVRFSSREELRAKYAVLLDDPEQRAETQRQQRVFRAFGLLRPEDDLQTIYEDLYAAQVAGYYDSEAKYLSVIAPEGRTQLPTLPLLDQIIFVHEMVHALQDQHFDLTTYLLGADGQRLPSDELMARLALAEGDAMLVMNVYAQRVSAANPLGTLFQLAQASAQNPALIIPPSAPPIVQRQLLWPYEQGEAFVRALFRQGGWGAVNAAYANPPRTTEQVFHPQKYLGGEEGQPVSQRDASAALGQGWTLVEDGVLGQFFLREWLRTQLGRDQAHRAASGWGGDAYHLYEDGSGRSVIAFASVWDNRDERDEFAQALRAMLEARQGRALQARADGLLCATGADVACMSQGQEVRAFIAPDESALAALLAP
ncbi:MAG: hypothetical protein NZ750_09355 [Anaerolineae bacterium]|nr:hypothetical protein [Anaerolineae bacterium]MDW8171826.1 hypothetical protein [Anaerolineae bacterium]